MRKIFFEMSKELPLGFWIILSPTRMIIDWWKKLKGNDPVYRGNVLRMWSRGLFFYELTCFLGLWMLGNHPNPKISFYADVFAIWYAASRCNEIAYAFYNDAMSRLKDADKTSNLAISDRILMAMRSYFGLAFNFAVLFYFLPIPDKFKPSLQSFFEAFYFSGVTLATIGYGDIAPAHWMPRGLVLYEAASGILIIAVAIATYMGDMPRKETSAKS
jgi:Ion channel